MKIMMIRSTDMNPTPRVEKSAKYLEGLGYTIRLAGWNREGDVPLYEKRSESLDIVRMDGSAAYGGGSSNAFVQLKFLLYVFVQMLKFKPDIVHAFDVNMVLPAYVYCRIFRKKLIFDICDMFAASRKLTGAAFSIVRWLENFFAAYADATIMPDRRRLAQYRWFKNRIEKQLVEISNTPYFPGEAALSMPDAQPADIVYVGVLQEDRYLAELCEIAARTGIKLNIGGYGLLDTMIKDYAEKHSNINFLGKLDYEKCLRAEKNARFIWAMYNTQNNSDVNNQFASPNKLFEALMLGVPLMVCKDSLIDKMVSENNFGAVLDASDPLTLKKQIMTVLQGPGKYAVEAMKKMYNEQYSFEIMRQRMQTLYKNLVKKG